MASPFDEFEDYTEPVAESEDSSLGALGALGVGGAALLALLTRNPGAAGSIGSKLNALRLQSMLAGKAVPKSVLGGVGATVIESAERGTTAPIKALFSRQTLDDIGSAYKAGRQVGPAGSMTTSLPGPMPGRIMGAFDEGISKAMQRGGVSVEDAETALLQTPLGKNFGKFGESLDSPEARHLLPFRRTPFNQFNQGMLALKESGPAAQLAGTARHPRVFNTIAGVGAAHGAATAEDPLPLSLPFAAATAGKYGLPYGAAAIVGRYLAGGKGSGGVAGSMLPVSEYGVTSSLTDPLGPLDDPFSEFEDY